MSWLSGFANLFFLESPPNLFKNYFLCKTLFWSIENILKFQGFWLLEGKVLGTPQSLFEDIPYAQLRKY